jgi:ubiquinone/menaquinone biosynthesis C-methylase UbiE
MATTRWNSAVHGTGQIDPDNRWDDLFADEKQYALVEPHPFVVRAIGSLQASGARTILDLGCGAGRHLVFLHQNGFRIWGCDKSQRGLLISRRKLAQLDKQGQLAAADFQALPFRDECFDAVISIHVLYHSPRIGMQKAVDETRRVLRSGGLFVGTFISTKAGKYGRGRAVERDTFIQPEGPETGVAHHYADEGDARDLMKAFIIECLDHNESRTIDNRVDYHWEVVARR